MKLGHTHLKVRNLTKSLKFYTEILNMEVTEVVKDRFAFLTYGNMHHNIALQEVGEEADSPGRYDTGLFHVAYEVAKKEDFAKYYFKLKEREIPVFAIDHHISWAMYFSDPDGNGMEIYVDTRAEPGGRKLWGGQDSKLAEKTIEEFHGK